VSRRGRVDIIADILVAAGEGDTKTGIMYRSNLNFARFERYFGDLIDVGLIEVADGVMGERRAVYRASKKAYRWLVDLKRVEKSIRKTVRK
jgi:predicted transcriptional regulator